MAAGLPVVTDGVGVNQLMVTNEKTGLIAFGEEQWASAIDRLADSLELRRQWGKAGRQKLIADNYTVTKNSELICGFLESR